MQDATSPPRKRWIQFTLRDCLIATIAIAATIAPFKLYERFHPPAQQVVLKAVVYRANAEKLREHVRGWNEGQLRTKSKDDTAAVVAQLCVADFDTEIVTAPTIMTIAGQEAQFAVGSSIPIISTLEGKTTTTMIDVGTRFSAKPTILRNGRIRFDLTLKQSFAPPATKMASGPIPASHVYPESGMTDAVVEAVFASTDQDGQQPEIRAQTLSIPAELAPNETIFIVDAGDQTDGKGTVIQVQVVGVR